MRAVTAILCQSGRILLLKRSQFMPTMPGLWSAVSGTIEGDETIPYRMRTEIHEETGIVDIRALSSCSTKITEGIWLHSVLCLAHGSVRLNSENVAYRWIRPTDLTLYETVPALNSILFLLLGSVGALAGEHYVNACTATHCTGHIISWMLAGSCMYTSGLFGVY